MNHAMPVSTVNGLTYLAEQLQALRNGKMVSIAVFVDRMAFDVVHDQIGETVVGTAAIEQLHNIGVIEHRQGLAFIKETAQELAPIEIRPQQLNGYLHAELLVGPRRQIDSSHATVAEPAL